MILQQQEKGSEPSLSCLSSFWSNINNQTPFTCCVSPICLSLPLTLRYVARKRRKNRRGGYQSSSSPPTTVSTSSCLPLRPCCFCHHSSLLPVMCRNTQRSRRRSGFSLFFMMNKSWKNLVVDMWMPPGYFISTK